MLWKEEFEGYMKEEGEEEEEKTPHQEVFKMLSEYPFRRPAKVTGDTN